MINPFPTKKKSRAIILRAADMLEQRGMCRGTMEVKGHVCMLQAIGLAEGRKPARRRDRQPGHKAADALTAERLARAAEGGYSDPYVVITRLSDSYYNNAHRAAGRLRELARHI